MRINVFAIPFLCCNGYGHELIDGSFTLLASGALNIFLDFELYMPKTVSCMLICIASDVHVACCMISWLKGRLLCTLLHYAHHTSYLTFTCHIWNSRSHSHSRYHLLSIICVMCRCSHSHICLCRWHCHWVLTSDICDCGWRVTLFPNY